MRSCLSNGMHRGGERDVTTICSRFRWIVMKEMNSLLWNGAVLACNQAPFSGNSVFVLLISPLDKLQLDPFIAEKCTKGSFLLI